MALRRLVEDAGLGAEAIERDEADGAAHGRVGPPTGPEDVGGAVEAEALADRAIDDDERGRSAGARDRPMKCEGGIAHRIERGEDRKSTRLNSSHVRISYAVFCLKKKKN